MATKKVGDLIKEARTNAGLSQEALAKKVDGVTATDIGKAERGEKELTQTALKAIAKATGVTQKSLLEAPSGVKKAASAAAKKTSSSTAAKKTSSTAAKKTSSSSAAKKTASSTAKKTSSSTAKKTSSSAAKKTASTTSVELSSAEKTLINAYRKADAETQKAALKLLKGEKDADLLSSLLSGAMDMLGNLGKK